MDEIKASPRKEWLYSLAQKLRSAPTKLGQANPILGALAESGKEYLTEPIARGLEHFAYGTRFGGPTNTPFIGSREEDMIAASPIGAVTKALPGAAALAQIVPALPLMNADSRAANALAKRIAGADRARAAGAAPEEIWTEFGLNRAPGLVHAAMTGKTTSKLRHTPWLEEINPENIIKKGFDPTRPGMYSADQVLDSPDLFRQYPHLRDIEFEIGDIDPKNLGEFAGWKGPAGRISIPADSPNFQNVATHEMSHGVMHNFGQGNSLGYTARDLRQQDRNEVEEMAELLDYSGGKMNKYGNLPAQLRHLAYAPTGRKNSRTGAWDLSSGEAMAEAAAERTLASPEFRKNVPPESMYPTKRENLLNDQVTARAAAIAKSGGTLDMKTERLLEALRRFGVLPAVKP